MGTTIVSFHDDGNSLSLNERLNNLTRIGVIERLILCKINGVIESGPAALFKDMEFIASSTSPSSTVM
jgi:hypothetical protein